MSEEPVSWRIRAYQMGVAVAWTGAAYFCFVFPLGGMNLFGSSDKGYGSLVAIGFFAGVSTLICGLIGKGPKRWVVVLAGLAQTAWWWLMAVGA